MTEQELKERGDIYRQLLDFAPFQYLVKEMSERLSSIRDAIAEDMTRGEDHLREKGLRSGIRMVIDTPTNAINEVEKIIAKENS